VRRQLFARGTEGSNPSASSTESVTEKAPYPAAELDRLCLDHIARFKRPRDYRFVEALPKNNYGKVLKTELRRLLTDNPEEGRPTR
jgi:acyl-coenzyme A synthetase/AMP-(fatty) acid ligase